MTEVRVACLCPGVLFDYGPIMQEIVNNLSEREARFETFWSHKGETPETLDFDAVVVSGSKFHVYDRQPWVEEAKAFLRNALISDIPCLGVCYGHQLLADTLGGTVKPMPEREMGMIEIEKTREGEDSVLLDGLEKRFRSFSSHEDHVAVVPEDAAVLARNDRAMQAFRSEIVPAWGVQFHPEYSLEMARELLETKENLSSEREERIRSELTGENFVHVERSRQVFANFFEEIVD